MSKKKSNIDRSTIDLEQFKQILSNTNGSIAGLSRFAGYSDGRYYNRLMYQERLGVDDVAILEKYLIHIGGPTTFEDAYNKMIREMNQNKGEG